MSPVNSMFVCIKKKKMADFWPISIIGKMLNIGADNRSTPRVDGQPDSTSGSGTGHFCSGVTCVWSGRGQISVVWQWVGGWSARQHFWLGYWSFLQWSDMRVEWERADLCGLTVGGWMVSQTALLAQVLVIFAVEWHACGVGEGRSLWSDSGWVDGQPDSASGSGTSPFCSGVTCVWSGRGQISVVWQWVGGGSAWQCFWLGY